MSLFKSWSTPDTWMGQRKARSDAPPTLQEFAQEHGFTTTRTDSEWTGNTEFTMEHLDGRRIYFAVRGRYHFLRGWTYVNGGPGTPISGLDAFKSFIAKDAA